MEEIYSALDLEATAQLTGNEALPSAFAVTELASWTMAAVGDALTELMLSTNTTAHKSEVQVDRTLASLWFGQSIHPVDWSMPPVWDEIAGDYQTSDGWIKLHTNLPHHRNAALLVLQAPVNRQAVREAVAQWEKERLESSIVGAGGVAAAMRSSREWQDHPQGQAIAKEPLIIWGKAKGGQHSSLARNLDPTFTRIKNP